MTRARSLGIFSTDIEIIAPTSQPSAPNQALVGSAPANPADPVQLSWLTVGGSGGASGGAGTVTSVDLTLPTMFQVSGGPVTGAGTLAVSLMSQPAQNFFAAPSGAAGAPSFRPIVASDLPVSGVSPGTYNSVTVDKTGRVTSGVSQPYGQGTVTSVGMVLPTNVFSVTGSPVTGNGNLIAALNPQPAGQVFAAPINTSGPPYFRPLMPTDIPIQGALDTIGKTQGAILYFKSGTWSELPPGNPGQVLAMNSGGTDPVWSAPPAGGGGGTTASLPAASKQGQLLMSGAPPTYPALYGDLDGARY